MFQPISLPIAPISGEYQESPQNVAARLWLIVRNICESISAAGKKAEQALPLDYMRQFTERHSASAQSVELVYFDAEKPQAASAAIVRHWVATILEFYANEFKLIAQAMGYELQISANLSPTTLAAALKDSLVALVADEENPSDCHILTDDSASEAKITNAQRTKLLAQWQKRQCDCAVCKKIAKNRQKAYQDTRYNFNINQPPFANFFQTALRNPQNTHTIDIISAGVRDIPENIDQCSSLRTFSLTNNFVSQLPESLFRLPKLEHLYLFKNRLQSLPSSIKNLHTLVSLDLSFNPIEILPDELGEMPSLRSLVVGSAPLRALPAAFPNAAQLANLYINDTAVSSLPAWLTQASKLERLSLANTAISAEEIDAFPFDKLPQLRFVSLVGLRLRRIPPALLHCERLEYLHLANNQITELPEEIGNFAQLATLELTQNQVAQLPASFCALTALTNFDLAGNPLTSLPANIAQMPKLSWARLSEDSRATLGHAAALLGQKIRIFWV